MPSGILKPGRTAVVFLFTAAVLAAGCSLFEGERKSEEIQPPPWLSAESPDGDLDGRASREARRLEALKEGEKLYRYACATCHGVLGDGRGPSAEPLDPKPRDLTTGEYIMGGTDREIYQSISAGVPGSTMPAWRDLLSRDQRWGLVEYVKSLPVRP